MKTILTGLLLAVSFLSSYGHAASLDSLKLSTDKGDKRIVLTFRPNVPGYSLIFDKSHELSEVHFHATGKSFLDKNYSFAGSQGGEMQVRITLDPSTKEGAIRISHTTDVTYYLAQETAQDLVLTVRGVASRHLASLAFSPAHLITLDVKDAPIEKLLRSLASESNHNLVFSDEVKGNVSVNVHNLPYKEAVDTILKPTPYRAENAGDVTVIRSDKTGKLFRAFQLKYVDASTVVKTIQDTISKDAQISVDTNTNTIFVVDKIESLEDVAQMLTTLDQEPKQVEVESAIVQLDETNALKVGMDYPAPGINASSGNFSLGATTSQLSPINAGDPGAQGMFVGLSWKSVKGILTALATHNKLSVLAKPRVLALNDQDASILIGSQLGYKTVTVTVNGNIENVQFITVGTQLKIKPHITDNNDILMYIKPEVSDGAVDPNTQVPSTTTTTTETRVLAKDGQTIIIGGLFRDRAEKIVNKVPILGDIPILGFLFRGVSNTITRTELLILLSPKIINADALAAQKSQIESVRARANEDLGLTEVKRMDVHE